MKSKSSEKDSSASSFEKADKLLKSYFQNVDASLLLSESELNKAANQIPFVTLLLNFPKQSYEYASENFETVFGMSSDVLLEGGLVKGMTLFEEENRKVFIDKVLPTIFEFFKKYVESGKDVTRIKVSYNLVMLDTNSKLINTIHYIFPMKTDTSGIPVIGIKYVYNTLGLKNENKIDFRLEYKNDKGFYETEYFESFEIKQSSANDLSFRELEILKLVRLGLASKEIANQLNISLNTVNNHRKNILKKYNAKNLHEVINNSAS